MAVERPEAVDAVNLPFDEIPYDDLSAEKTWSKLGRGSFGCVWKGQYLGLIVAIKEVFQSDDYSVDKYFERESALLQEIRHPNIILYLGLCLAPPSPRADADFESRQQRILIITEYCEGGNLRAFIGSKEPFPWRVRLSFAVDMARAVAYLHARGCMHRDIKGDNLLITENGRIKLADFGFARMKPRSSIEQRRLSYCGTDNYLSPEISVGEVFGVSTDIFSFGIVLCELISRRLADEDTFALDPVSHAVDPQEIISLAKPGCPPALLVLAMECTAKDADLRPDARQLLSRLMSIEASVVQTEQAKNPFLASHVGSVKFASTISSKGAARKVPRMPSFEGQVVVPMSQLSTRGSLADLGKGHPPRGAMFSLANGPIDADRPYEDGADREEESYSKGTDSTLTVRASPPRGSSMRNFTDDSVPSIPESWLRESAGKEGQGDSASSSDESELETPMEEETNAALATSSFMTARTSSTVSNNSQYMHRFSLVRPAWLRLIFGMRGHAGSDKCSFCEKKLGSLAYYLSCDDCGFLCADAAAFECRGSGSDSDEAVEKALVSTNHLKVRPKSRQP